MGWSRGKESSCCQDCEAVRGFSLARRPGKQVEAVLDFSLVMEVDEEEEEEGRNEESHDEVVVF